ncbi:MAG: hypothetical protein HRT89_08795 [Lentisphaeria bacterium]|nr:hypothetical protein [Lentisphaeria bacterium]NQZ68155.1 hypothetical protein [Lentisphaeria bacterium]
MNNQIVFIDSFKKEWPIAVAFVWCFVLNAHGFAASTPITTYSTGYKSVMSIFTVLILGSIVLCKTKGSMQIWAFAIFSSIMGFEMILMWGWLP